MNFSTPRDGIVMFSRYFKQFGISVQITLKVLICSRIGPEKVPILLESPYFPLLQLNSTQSPDGKILEGLVKIVKFGKILKFGQNFEIRSKF